MTLSSTFQFTSVTINIALYHSRYRYDAGGLRREKGLGLTGKYEWAVSASFVYDGDGNRVEGTIGTTTTTFIGNYLEWTGNTITMNVRSRYYHAGSTRVAMRTGSSTLNYLLGDHLGSQAITTDSNGNRTGEIRYNPWGTGRYSSGTTPTTYHFTGQRLESALGLYYYGARWYDPYLNRWIQPDSIIPDPNNSQSYDRYAYALNNPVRYTDPTGHITQAEASDAEDILNQLASYNISIAIDWGMKNKKWANGLWTIAELQTVLDSVQDLANAMGGTDNFKTNLGGATISQKSMKYGGVGKAHEVTMNANGFSKWAVVHELVHAWDGSNGWDLSEDLKSSLGAGFDHPILHFLFPNNSNYWYDPGQGPPPAGLDANFNAKEDFAESVTAFVYPGEASNAALNRGWPYNDSSRGYSYSSFLYTPRGQYVYALLVSSP